MSVKKQEHNLLPVLVQKLRKIVYMQNIAICIDVSIHEIVKYSFCLRTLYDTM